MTFDPFKASEWIFVKGEDPQAENGYFDYKAEFEISSHSATLYISAYSAYAVWVNGVFVNCGQMADYEEHQIYERLDLSSFVKEGKNELLITQFASGVNTSTVRKQTAGVIFSVFEGEGCVLASGVDILSGRNNRYLPDAELVSPQLNFNFSYDANASETVFQKSVLAKKEKRLFERRIKKADISRKTAGVPVKFGSFSEKEGFLLKAERIQNAILTERKDGFSVSDNKISWDIKDGDGVFVIFDLLSESVGFLELVASLPKGTEVLIGYGEHIADGRVRARLGNRNFAARYIVKSENESFFHPFLRLGARYIELHVYSKKGSVDFAGVVNANYPVTHLPAPILSEKNRKIWDIAAKTLMLCMHEHYEDCPWREQAMYAMDSRIQILCGYYAFGESEFPREALEMMSYSIRDDGLLELCPPGKVPNGTNIPAFTAVYIREIWEYTLYCKDNSLALEVFDCLKAIADGFVGRIDETGLIPLYRGKQYWNFYEWRKGLDGSERFENDAEKVYEAPLCAFVADALHCFSLICKAIRPALASYYEDASRALKSATFESFFDFEAGGFVTRHGDEKPLHELTQALMLYIDAVPEKYVDGVEELIMSGELAKTSVSMTVFSYEALLKNKKNADFVLSDIESVWGKMAESGADTFWETEKGEKDFSNAGSLCHGWSAVPIYIFAHYGLGK